MASTPATPDLADWLARFKSADEAVYGPAWLEAPRYGAAAIKPMATLLSDPNFEVMRRAERALGLIVHSAGRPGGRKEARAAERELLPFLRGGSLQARRDVLWLLSEIGGDNSVNAIAAMLTDRALRDDARCVLERLPGRKSLGALKAALQTVPEDFRPALADSLRARGETVREYPSRKLIPSAKTTVVPLQPRKQ